MILSELYSLYDYSVLKQLELTTIFTSNLKDIITKRLINISYLVPKIR